MKEEKLIFKSLLSIMDEIGVIGKNKKNTQQNYNFRGIDDMYNELHPLFCKYGVFITSEVLPDSQREERVTQKGGLLIYSIIDVKFTFHALDGSSVSSIIKGEGMDSGDKATNKAISTALKYALMQMFLIPTEEKLDTEYDSPEPTPKETKTYPEDNRPWITDKQVQMAIVKIQNGESGIYEECDKHFKMSKANREKIKNA